MIMNAAWAIFTILITPKTRVSPEAIKAYTPPKVIPNKSTCTN
jgi:hypothetical protein